MGTVIIQGENKADLKTFPFFCAGIVLFYNSCRTADGNAVGRNIFGDNRIGADHRMLPDPDVGHDADPFAEPDFIFDNNRTGYSQRLHHNSAVEVFETMQVIGYIDIVRHGHVSADFHFIAGNDVAAVPDICVVPYPQFRMKFVLEIFINGFNPAAGIYSYILTDVQSFNVPAVKRRIYQAVSADASDIFTQQPGI